MPTNIPRKHGTAVSSGDKPARRLRSEPREIFIHAGTLVVRARLLDTPTADRIWATLPVYSTAETWGRAIQIETHAETGREASAKATVEIGEIAYWIEKDRVIVAFGRTPISRPGEVRLPAPCNIFARALDDVGILSAVQPGQKIAILEAAS